MARFFGGACARHDNGQNEVNYVARVPENGYSRGCEFWIRFDCGTRREVFHGVPAAAIRGHGCGLGEARRWARSSLGALLGSPARADAGEGRYVLLQPDRRGGRSRSPSPQQARHGYRLGESSQDDATTAGIHHLTYTPAFLPGALGHDAGADTGPDTSRAGGHLHPPQAATGTTPGRCRLSLPIPQTGRSLSGRRVTSSRQPAYPHLPCQFGCLPGLLLLTALQRRASFLEATR
mgnify:CR=1 FL=1